MSLGLLTSSIRTLKSMRDASTDKFLGMVSSRLVDTSGDYSHILQPKTRLQMVLLSCAVCGIEFCYAAETAFVSPILLQIGIPIVLMTFVWCLSPLLGFTLVPVLGSLSDKCRSKLGRRRPFILLLSVGIILGLILVPNGERISLALDLKDKDITSNTSALPGSVLSTKAASDVDNLSSTDFPLRDATTVFYPKKIGQNTVAIFVTVLGVVMLDFCCDACQSPCRAYLLDVSIPEDHPTGLTTFTVMAGMGGCVGYIMGGIDWNNTSFGESFGGHVRVVFTLVLILYLVCLTLTLTSVKEVPLDKLGFGEACFQKKKIKVKGQKYEKFSNDDDEDENHDAEKTIGNSRHVVDYGATTNKSLSMENPILANTESTDEKREENTSISVSSSEACKPLPSEVSLKTYLLSIIRMPSSLLALCVTNLFCWMSLVCYSLYFTDFVGQAVYGGDPNAALGSRERLLYESGVRTGSFSMSLYSISCSAYSLSIERLVGKFGARPVYITSQLVYTFGAVMMTVFPHPAPVIIMSPCAGVMYATLFTMPYILIAHYHDKQQFEDSDREGRGDQIRGLGTDIAVLSSMVFVAQFLLSAIMGPLVYLTGSTRTVMTCAAVLSACGAASATRVMYLGL